MLALHNILGGYMRIQEHLQDEKVALKPPKGKPIYLWPQTKASFTHRKAPVNTGISIYKLTSIAKGVLAVNKLGNTQKNHSKISGI